MTLFFKYGNKQRTSFWSVSGISIRHTQVLNLRIPEPSRAEVNFLDVTVVVVGESLKTKLYRKPTDSLKYLYYNSCHPRHCKTSIPCGQAHRFRRICSDEGEFNAHAAHFRGALIEQNYPPPVVDNAIERARALDRDKLLTGTSPD
ncbi:uncharacterized protein ISCGN_025420 [Ixodes scapularis]